METNQKVQVSKLNFNYNWNNKLLSNFFTTIRLHNSNKYQVNQLYAISLNDVFMFHARCVSIYPLLLEKLTLLTASLDTGYGLYDTTIIIKKMYPRIDFSFQQIAVMLFEKEKDSRKIYSYPPDKKANDLKLSDGK